MRYCQYCGKPMTDSAKFCADCGKSAQWETRETEQQALVEKLSTRTMVNGIIWLIIAVIQLACGFGAWWLFLIGGLNMIRAIADIVYSRRIMTNQNGIVQTHKPLVGVIITLIYNLLFGGVIGVIGSIYYLIFVRGLVMENKSRFLEMETTGHTGETVQEEKVQTDVVLTETEAANGVERDVFIEEFRKALKVRFPKGIKDGQAVVLRNVEGTDRNGKTVKKDVLIKVKVE